MKNIRVLIADDEPIILRGLKKLLPWDRFGIEFVGEAHDGNELLEKYNIFRPDLIISDICMPGCSGIDFLKKISVQKTGVKVVFISAYQEFSYAQDAVKYGALDYLLKPVDKNQLEQVIQRTALLIREEAEGARHQEMLNQLENQQRYRNISELLDRLTDGDQQAAEELAPLGVMTDSKYITVCLAELDRLSEDNGRWQEQERKLVDFAVTNIIHETVTKYAQSFVFRKGDTYGIFLQHDRTEEPLAVAQHVYEQVRSCLKLELRVGIGLPQPTITKAGVSRKQAAEALKSKYFDAHSNVLIYQKVISDCNVEVHLTELRKQLVAETATLSAERLPALMTELLDAVEHARFSPNTVVSFLYATYMMIQQELKGAGLSCDSPERDSHLLFDRWNSFPSYARLRQEMELVIDQIVKQIKEKNGSKELRQLVHAKAYIEENYMENITLESIATIVFMNPYYFSSFFKKHTGENFKQYVTQVRMKHALQLLMQTDLLVYEIADRVGYNNARHFSDMFKKIFGKLPQEYKQSARQLS
ncbi:response regulator [Paenibacillus maysiensis]|uniref:response regulator n=1 Tax=Paenibacillus maysiensis TaxID=1155954 RepID=UPI000472D53E|nr:response regulator [Paenibacillus maysiensis]